MAMSDQCPANGKQYKNDFETYNTADALEQSMGGAGFSVIADTAEATPPTGECFYALQMIGDTVLDDITAHASAPIDGTATGITFPAGFVLYGKFTAVTLTSGSCIAYVGQL
jgi:hypothetical protein